MAKNTADKSVRQKIIDTAGDVFGRAGYKAATIREICREADVNVAAINYHFGGKQELYRTVVTDLISRIFAQYPVDEGVDESTPPQTRLRAFIHGMLRRLLSPDGLSGYSGKGQLVAKELADPSPFLDDMVEEFIQPVAIRLFATIHDMLGPEATAKHVARCQISVIGQCFHYAVARPIINRLNVADYADNNLIDELTEHITRFSLAGIEATRKSLSAGQNINSSADQKNGGAS